MTSASTNANWAGAAGNATLAFCGHWIGRGLVWAFRHPLSSGMTLVLSSGIGLGAVNAMFLQTAPHPAPLFMETASIAQPPAAEAPVVDIQPFPTDLSRPVQQAVVPQVSVPEPEPVIIPDNVGNADVAELQARLTELGYFAGKIDGYYGPKTADAIRRFEAAAGLDPVGAVTPAIIEAANAFVPAPVPEPVPQAARPQPVIPTLSDPAPALTSAQAPAPVNDPIGRIAAGAEEDQKLASVAPVADIAPAKPAAIDPELVRMVQTGLSRLGFLHGEVSGSLDDETARAIREFENYNNFVVTGELTPDLVDVLMAAGAYN